MKIAGIVGTAAAALLATGGLITPAAAADSTRAAEAPCPDGARRDTGNAEGNQYVLCSYDPGFGKMSKDFYAATGDGYELRGSAPQEGITRTFAMASASNAGIGATYNDVCMVYSTFDGGRTWSRTLEVVDGGTAENLEFTDARHGSVECMYGSAAATYVTSDGGRTWTKAA